MTRPDKSSSTNYPTVRRLGLEGACSARPRTRVIMTANQISRQRLQSIVMTVRPTVFDRHVPALYEATFGQAPAEYSSNGGSLVRPPKGKIPNHGRRRLLRVGRERPRQRRPVSQARCWMRRASAPVSQGNRIWNSLAALGQILQF
jgi:hypothetical protein